MNILTIAKKKQNQKLKQDKHKQLEKERWAGGTQPPKWGFSGLFFPLFHLLLHSTPGSHTREESKIALITNAIKNERKILVHQPIMG